MEFDIIWILLGLPIAFALGWLASRLDLKQLRLENQLDPKPYFKAVTHLINEQQDLAIDAFTEAIKKDPHTVELQLTVAQLFRQRGEYESAIKTHEHLLQRADITKKEQERAQYGLALDFLKAGLLDRAEEALLKLKNTKYHAKAWFALLSIHERGREWDKAIEVAGQLKNLGSGDFSHKQIHYLCEKATSYIKAGGQENTEKAIQSLQKAIKQDHKNARALIQLAGIHAAQNNWTAAYENLKALDQNESTRQYIPLISSELIKIAQNSGQKNQAIKLLKANYEKYPAIDTIETLIQNKIQEGEEKEQALAGYLDHIQKQPSVLAIGRWLSQTEKPIDPQSEEIQAIKESMSSIADPLRRYRCAACRFETQGYFWQCPGCQSWETFPPTRIDEL